MTKIVNFLEVGISFDLAPTEAIAVYIEKGLKPSFAWQDMLGAEHDAAFTVAKMMDTDLLQTVKAKFDKALAEGATLADFKKQLIPELQAAGWWGKKDVIDPLTGLVTKAQLGSASRLETIFRSNMQSAYATGQWDSITKTAKALPYLLYDAVDDHRTRPEHAARDGEVHPVHSDFWKTHYPPNGWNCRCGVVQLSQEDIDDMGITPIKAPTIKTRKWVNPRTGTVMDVPIDTDPGWNHNPGIARQQKLLQQADDKAAKLLSAERKAHKVAMAQREYLSARYKKQLDQNAALQALLKPAEEAKLAIGKALKENTKYLATEIKKLQDAKPGMDPIALLAKAEEKALKSKQNSLLQTWKQANKKGKTPSAQAQEYFNTLPAEQQADLLAEMDQFTGVSAAKAELGAIAAGNAAVQTKLKQKIFSKWSNDGTAAGFGNDPKGLVAAIEKEAAAQQAKAEQASVLSGYKKKVIDGKIPTPKQQQVFNNLDDATKAKVLADIDAKKPSIEAPKINTPNAEPAVAAPKPKPAAVQPMKYDDLSDAEKYKVTYYATGADEAGFPDPDLFLDETPNSQKAYIKELESVADDFSDEDGGGKALLQQFIDDAAKDGEAWAIKGGKKTTAAVAEEVAEDFVDPGAPDPAKLTQIGGQAGSNTGGLYLDPETGQKWYLKQPKSEEIARNEVLAGKFYEAAGIEVPEMHNVVWNGKPGIASKIIDGLQANRSLLTGDADVPGVADGFMMDAWLGNWDVVGMSYDNLLVKAGRAIRVDTGGALRFRAQGTAKGKAFGNEVLEITSLTDGTASQTTAVFGKLSREQIIESARRVVAFTDTEIDDLVGAYGPLAPAERTKLANTLKARRDDIAKKYPEALEKKAPAAKPSAERVTRVEQENIANSRSNGYSIATDKDSIEDQNVLVWQKSTADGKGTTNGYLKIRGDAEAKLQSELTDGAPVGDYNEIHQEIVTAVKSIRFRIDKGDNDISSILPRLRRASESYKAALTGMRAEVAAGARPQSQLDELIAKAGPFVANIDATLAANKPVWNPTKGNYTPFKIELPKQAPSGGGRTWSRRKTQYNLSELDKGFAREKQDLFSVNSDVYETVVDGTTIRYWPDRAGVLWALRGRIEIQAPGKSQASAARVFEALEELGIDASRATEADIEALYLRQIAYANKLDTKAPFKNAINKGQNDRAKAWLSSQLGIDLDKTPHYRPEGERQAFEHGRRTRYRPELLGNPEWSKFEQDYKLIHSVTNGSMEDALQRVLNGGGQMAPSTDKIRRGIPLGGMSPEQDLETGGANYFFTRIQTTRDAYQSEQIVWKSRVAARTDAITYDGDKYGRTTGDYVRKNRKYTIEQMRQAARSGSNETIIKDSLSLFDDLDRIVVYNQERRDAIIKIFQKAGYADWPDGRSLTDVIKIAGQP